MSAKIKTTTSKAAKFFGIAVFVFLMSFNVQLSVSNNSSGDVDLLGLKILLFTPTAYAAPVDMCDDICSDSNNAYCTYIIGHGYCFGYFS